MDHRPSASLSEKTCLRALLLAREQVVVFFVCTVNFDGRDVVLGFLRYGFVHLRFFHSRVCQVLFNQLHPWLAYRFGTDWSNSNRRKHGGYKFKGEAEPLYKFCLDKKADYQIFGHFHDAVDMALPTGSRLIVLKDWIGDPAPHYAVWDGSSLEIE